MRRALAAVALMLVVAANPVATLMCEAACAARDAMAQTPAHTCHQQTAQADGPAVAAIHVCGHDDGLPSAFERLTSGVGASAVAVAAVVPPVAPALSFTPRVVIGFSPPTPLATAGQLRI